MISVLDDDKDKDTEVLSPVKPLTTRDFTDVTATRRAIYDNVLNSFRNLKPVSNSRYQLSLADLNYEDPEEYPLKKQKEAILSGTTLSRRIRGTWRLTDPTGTPVAEKKATVAQVPFLTPRGTFIMNGTEYALINQMRLRPGVFTRVKENGEVESHFNVMPGKGLSHRYFLDPETGIFKINIDQSHMPLVPVMRALGVTDKEMKEAWGQDLYAANALKDDPKVIDKIYARLVKRGNPKASFQEKQQAIAAAMQKMEFDPEVTSRTLGQKYRNLDKTVALAATRKLLDVSRAQADPDDRDHLAFQNFLGPEDLFAERASRAGNALNQLLWKATYKNNLDAIQPNALTKQVNSAIYDSGLAQGLEEINTAEILDQQTRVSRMGVGGIPCYSADTDVLTDKGWVSWTEVTADTRFACRVNGELVFEKASALHVNDYRGPMFGVSTDRVDYLVTPCHRVYGSFEPYGSYTFREAQEVHGNTFTALVSQDGKETALVTRTTESNPFFIEDYDAKVYCASVPGGLLYVRRNGKCHWSGNSLDSVPDEARSVHPSQLGYIDTIRTPESLKAGVDSRLAFSTRKGSDNKVYAKFLTPNGEEIWRSPQEVSDFVIAFPNEMGSGKEHVVAMVNGQTKMVPRESVQLVMPHFENAFSPLSNMIPLKGTVKGQRVAMGSRFLTQALPLRDPEAPLVQAGMPGKLNTSFEEHYGQYLGAIKAADKTGRVRSADNDSITVQYEDGETKTYDLYNNFPYARKTFAHSTPLVKEGDPVRPGQLLARSNNTDEKGTVALGKNLKVGYISFRGLNYEDAIVISESAAKKLSSEHMYQNAVEFDKSSKKGKNNFVSIFPTKFERRLLDQIDDDGVIKPGTVVKEGDPLILMARQRDVSHRQVHSTHGGSFADSSVVWDHHNEGVVTDVAKTAKGITVAVKAYAPLVVGDKLANRFGGKGIVSSVVPDSEMPHNEAGEPLEILMNPLGVISRGNPSQIVETVLGKIAAKTGRPYKVLDWDENVKDWTEYAQKELEKYGLKDTETVTDPVSGRNIKDILTGSQFILKLQHTAEGKQQGRGLGSYNAEGMPAKGGGEGGQSKRLALMDVNALLSSGATEVLRDAKLIRGQKNQEYWSSFMGGFRPPTPKAPQVYEKFINSLKASGINVQRDGSHLNLMALTDKDVESMAEGRELQNVETVDWKDGMKPVKGGLFDPTLTGSHGGNRWSYIKLHEMMPSPVMEEPIRKLLGLTQKKFEDILGGKEKLGDTTGPEAIHNALKAINLDQGITQAREDIRSGKKTLRSDAVKRLNYLAAAKKTGVHPSDWMISKLPVLPPMFRPVSIMQGTGGQLVSDANYLYKEAWDANENLNSIKGQVSDTADERLTLYNAIKGVTGIGDPISPKNQEKKIKGVLQQVFGSSPKYSTVQYKLLGANMDLVGRAVVAPNPDLNMDEVGLPEDRAWAVYTPFVIRRLVMNGVSRVNALQYVKNRDEIARKALLSEIDSRPVVVTRAPVLHRYGEMAFWPKLTKSNVLQVNPTIVGSYGMDFDGDQQIGIVFASIDRTCLNNIDWIVVNDQSNLEEHRMPFSAGLRLPTLDKNDDLYVFNLEDFPHLEQIEETKGQFGRIEWYRVPEGIKILSHGPDGQLTWTQVSRWSKHHGCPVEIVNLRSGRQIFTDDDPRAVYGVAAGTLELKRFRPAAAVEARVLVPRVVEMPEASLPEPTVTSLATVGYANATSNREFGMFDNISIDEDLGYLIGCAAGDGWVPEERKAFVLSGITQPIIDKVDQIIGRLFPDKRPACLRTESKTSYGESQWHTWNSTHLARMIAELIGQKSQYKHLPVWFLKAPREFRLGLFAGIMDTDGSISVSKAKKKPQLMANVTSTSLRLTQEVSLLALSLGIRGRITNSKTPAGNPCWVWSPSNYDIYQWGGRSMVHPNKLAALESAPVEMSGPLARHDVVPVPTAIADLICKAIPKPNKERKTWLPGHGGMYSAFHDAKSSGHITRLAAEKIVEFIPGGKVDHPEWDAWRTVVANTHITWDPVESFEKTGRVEIGYDLTVPGPETFMAADGVILSNTSNYYVPATDEARDEAVAKMMPSRNLFSVRTFKADTYKPSQEYVGGLWAATAQVDNQKSQKTFASVKDAIRAFYNNNVDIDQQVSVLEH